MACDNMESRNELFFSADTEELKKGCRENDKEMKCLICGETYEKGVIFPFEGRYFDAGKRMKLHLEKEHGSMLHFLLNSGLAGVSEIQSAILAAMAEGLSDKEIAARQQIAQSTVRNHRFKLREKERQARVFLAIMELMKESVPTEENDPGEKLCEPHRTASMVDDRYVITEEERTQILGTFFDENGHLKEIPAREKRKVVILRKIAENFKPGTKYTETEVNRILKRINDDFPYIRRLMIEYGFLDRTSDCSSYWIKE